MQHSQFSFERLIHPFDQASLLQQYWQRQPLLIARAEQSYYSDLLCGEDIDSIVGFRQLKYSQLKLAQAVGGQQSQAFYADAKSASDTNQLFHSYAQGHTVVLNFVHCYWEPAARLCSALQGFFNFPTGANVYVTPRNAQGFAPHFDAHDVFVLQVEGSKIWRLYEEAQRSPSAMENEPVAPALLGKPTREIRLNAGDLLYLPRGCVHEARTTDASSIHVSVGVRAYRWADLLSELLTLASQHDANFQMALPPGFMSSEDALTQMEARLPELLRALAVGGWVEDGVGRLRERLIERMPPLPNAQLRSLDQLDGLTLETVVAKRTGMLCHVSRKAGLVELAFPGNRLTGPAEIEPAFQFMANAQTEFPISALPDMLSDASKLVLAKRAVKEGLLTIPTPALGLEALPDDRVGDVARVVR